MKIYRSMCTEEFERTIRNQTFDFSKSRFKWFTPNLDYQSRVRDGSFNNSNIKSERYEHLIEFEIDDSKSKWFFKIGRRELLLDRRTANQVPVKNIQVILKEI